MEGFSIPIVDLEGLKGEDPEQHKIVAEEIKRACHEVGFMYIRNHGVPPQTTQGMLEATSRLFDLDLKEKMALDASKSPCWRGYNSLETGAHSCTPQDGPSRDLKESFTLGMERQEGDPRAPTPLHGANQWPSPDRLPHWRSQVQDYMASLFDVARLVMKGMALALGVEEDFFWHRCDDATAQMVLFKYPPARPSQADRGCGAHTDCGFLTFLTQNNVQGLEVRTVTGEWVPALPVEGTIIVNLGDMMARWSNDFFKSTEHRVRSPSGDDTRLSVAFFLNPNFHAEVECITSCGEEAKYPPVKAGHYLLEKLGLMWMADAEGDAIAGKKDGKEGN